MTILFMSFHLSILSFISQLFVVYLLHSISFIAHSFFTNGMKSLFFYFFCHKRTATYFLIRYPPPPPNPHSQTSISNFTFQMFNSHPRSCHPSVPVLLLLFPTLVSFFCAFTCTSYFLNQFPFPLLFNGNPSSAPSRSHTVETTAEQTMDPATGLRLVRMIVLDNHGRISHPE